MCLVDPNTLNKKVWSFFLNRGNWIGGRFTYESTIYLVFINRIPNFFQSNYLAQWLPTFGVHSFKAALHYSSTIAYRWALIVPHTSSFNWNDTLSPHYILPRPMAMTYFMERWTLGHPPYRICHWIVLIPTSSFLPFPGEASYTYFFRREVSASRILQVPVALFLEFFQKLFAVCKHPTKTFLGPGVK